MPTVKTTKITMNPRRSRDYDKLLRKLNERLDSATESIQREACKVLAEVLMHLDAVKERREREAIRLRIAKLESKRGGKSQPEEKEEEEVAVDLEALRRIYGKGAQEEEQA